MKKCSTLLALALGVTVVQALPQLGYYKARYSADKNYTCMQVTSNTKQVIVDGVKITYFEFVGPQGPTPWVCIPQVFYDTDDTPVDGDPAHLLFKSSAVAHCTAADGSMGTDVAFSSNRIFWTGDSYPRVTAPGMAASAVLRMRERQTLSAEFFSASSCPP